MNSCSPYNMKYSREDEFIVQCDGHVARLMKRRGDGPHRVTQIHTPQQKEELSCLKERTKS